MYRYVLKRLLLMIPVLLGISFVIFGLMSLSPGDPARMILGESASMEDVLALQEEMGLNDPFLVRYFTYVANMLKGDFGVSYTFRIPVFDAIGPLIPSTVKLALGSLFIMVIFGIPIGILSAVKKYTWIDTVSLMGALFLTSMPAFWLGLMLILLFALKLHWLPSMGVDSFKNYILPCVTLAAGMMANLVRMTRSSMLEVLKQDYIRTARAKGATERVVIYKHALRNALMPIITVVGLNFGSMLGGAVVVESVFAMPGLGTLIISSVRMKDTPLVVASVLLVAFFAGMVNLVVDVLYAYVDPRIKSRYAVSRGLKRREKAKEAAAQ
ncbi:MAG: nickel ABC transporter permease [Oscillospiraceae bacterium]|nr:nickel ABC transporter permease [Oscillospiraceae bacterium]